MAENLRVLHVFKTYYPDTFGGIEQVIRQLCIGTEQLGVHNRIFTLSRHAAEMPELQDAGIPITRAPMSMDIASTPMSVSAITAFRKAVATVDLVHYHYPWPFGDLLHLLGGQGKPAILTYHSDVVRQRLLMHVYLPLMRRFFGKLDAIVPTSPNYLESSQILQDYREKCHVIPIGVDENSYPAASEERLRYWRDEVGDRFFLFVGVLRYYKGLHILLDAMVNSHVKVVIMGAGPVEAELKQQAARLNLTNVRFVGALPDEDKVALLTLCHGVVFPSHLRSEAFGVTLLEGAVFGKPLISSDIGTGSSYVNINGVTGLVIPPNDPAALREAMHTLADDADLAQAMGKQARERFEKLFTATEMARSYSDLYHRVMEYRAHAQYGSKRLTE